MEEKIKALIAKAMDQGATEAERTEAMALARRLMAKHGLTETDLENVSGDDYKGMTFPGFPGRIKPIDYYCGGAIGNLAGVSPYVHLEGTTLATTYYGLAGDVEFAHWLRSSIEQQMEAQWAIYKRARVLRTKDAYKKARISFIQGYLVAAACVIREQCEFLSKKDAAANQLVVSKQAEAKRRKEEEVGAPFRDGYYQASRDGSDASAAGFGAVSGAGVRTSGGNIGRGTIQIGKS